MIINGYVWEPSRVQPGVGCTRVFLLHGRSYLIEPEEGRKACPIGHAYRLIGEYLSYAEYASRFLYLPYNKAEVYKRISVSLHDAHRNMQTLEQLGLVLEGIREGLVLLSLSAESAFDHEGEMLALCQMLLSEWQSAFIWQLERASWEDYVTNGHLIKAKRVVHDHNQQLWAI